MMEKTFLLVIPGIFSSISCSRIKKQISKLNRMRKTLLIEVFECDDPTIMEEGWAE